MDVIDAGGATVTASTGRGRLTPRQREMLGVIVELTTRDGHPPTVREIGRAMGIKSPNGVKAHLNPMRREGVVDWDDGFCRTLRLVAGCVCPTCRGLGRVIESTGETQS